MKAFSPKIIILYVFTMTLWLAPNQYILSQSKINFLEANLILVKPVNAFGRNLHETRFGFELGYLRQVKSDKPFFWGISTYYSSFGTASATLSELLYTSYVDISYSSTSQLLGFNGKFRFYPTIYLGKFEWYTEALLGYKWLYTTTNRTVSETDSSESNINSGKLSLSYGIATGINYEIADKMYINLRVNFIPGLSNQYYVINPSNEVKYSSLDLFDLKKSTSDIVRWDIGITFWPTFNNE